MDAFIQFACLSLPYFWEEVGEGILEMGCLFFVGLNNCGQSNCQNKSNHAGVLEQLISIKQAVLITP